MTTQGIGHIYVETHNWGKAAAFWQSLGFTLEFETDHHSGGFVAPNGTRLFLAEQGRDDPVGMDVYLDVASTAETIPGEWDPRRLEQIVGNLLSNAIKYGSGRPIEVDVRASDEIARVSVADRGIGIEKPLLQRIFGRFERAVSDRHYGGLGLGLYITRQIVEALGGTVNVTSTLGAGATFTVQLPLEATH